MNARKRPLTNWLRCASVIHKLYEMSRLLPSEAESRVDFNELVDRLNRLGRQKTMAIDRRWKSSEQRIGLECRRQLELIRESAAAELGKIAATSKFESNQTELFRDLLSIKDEFANVTFDAKAKLLTVTTSDITLEDFRFGAFQIVLHLASLSTTLSQAHYEVVALDANPSSLNDSVTHPHIQDGRLCEGDAQPAIKIALQQGRILDFFQIVEQTIGTYNSSSAYVTLDEWDGVSCGACGHSTSPNEAYVCGCCETTVCSSCFYRCTDCEDAFCGNCDLTCDGCLESVCKSCAEECSDCDEQFCSDCRTEKERCTNCEKKAKEEPDEAATETSVHANSLGKVGVPA